MAGDQIPSRSELLDQLAKGPIVEPRGLLSARLEAMEAMGLVVHGWVGEGKLGYRLAPTKTMDPQRLQDLRDDTGHLDTEHDALVSELLADRDHWHARAEKAEARLERELAGHDAASKACSETGMTRGHILDLASRLTKAEAEVARLREQHIQTSAACESYAAEAKRYRARCPVTAEDVEAAGVTQGSALEVAVRHGWHDLDSGAVRNPFDEEEAYVADEAWSRAELANAIADSIELCPLDILAEMAAIEVEP